MIHLIRFDRDGDCNSAFKADNPKPRPDVVPSPAALRRQIETLAIVFYALDVAERHVRSVTFGDPVVKSSEIILGLRGEDDRALLHACPLSRFVCFARIRANTSLAGRAREGSAFIAS